MEKNSNPIRQMNKSASWRHITTWDEKGNERDSGLIVVRCEFELASGGEHARRTNSHSRSIHSLSIILGGSSRRLGDVAVWQNIIDDQCDAWYKCCPSTADTTVGRYTTQKLIDQSGDQVTCRYWLFPPSEMEIHVQTRFSLYYFREMIPVDDADRPSDQDMLPGVTRSWMDRSFITEVFNLNR